jgi:hypothetical protein
MLGRRVAGNFTDAQQRAMEIEDQSESVVAEIAEAESIAIEGCGCVGFPGEQKSDDAVE